MAEIPSIMLLWGPEDYLIDRRVGAILREMTEADGSEPEIIPVDSAETPLRELGQILAEVPLFAFRRVIILRHPVWLQKAKKGEKEEFEKIVHSFAEQVQFQMHFIILTRTLPASKPLVTLIKRAGAVEELAALNTRGLADWINAEIAQRGLHIDREALNAMVKSNRDMYYLLNEIERLALCHPGTRIDVSMLTGLEQEIGDVNIFNFTDALLRKNAREAMKALDLLLEKGEPITLIVHMITREMIFLGKVQALAAQGRSAAEIASYLDKKSFRIDKMRGAAISIRDLSRIFEYLGQIDFAVKNTSQDHRLLLETLVVDICEV